MNGRKKERMSNEKNMRDRRVEKKGDVERSWKRNERKNEKGKKEEV